jgi:AcrR family transcriptional regulator
MKAQKLKLNTPIDSSTEEKIKIAARKIFTQKGYSATRTRDIAEEAGINLALLNYYFRSKEKLFDLIMLESFHNFMQAMIVVFNNDKTTLEEKVELIVANYIDLLVKDPDLPIFILSELRSNPKQLILKADLKKNMTQSHFFKQVQEAIKAGKIAQLNPMHFLINIIGMAVFPFVASPLIKSINDLKQEEFDELMQQRKKLIPKWIKTITKVS